MNTKLVESLAQVIESLAPKDDRDYQGQTKFIDDFLQSQTTELSDRLIRIQKQNQPKSSTPVFIIREY
jgi:hypothetical protein